MKQLGAPETGHLNANREKFWEALGGWKAGDLSLPPGSPARRLLLGASRGEGCCQPCTQQSRWSSRQISTRNICSNWSSSLGPSHTQPAPARAPDRGWRCLYLPWACLSGAPPLPPGAAQCVYPSERGPSQVTSTPHRLAEAEHRVWCPL